MLTNLSNEISKADELQRKENGLIDSKKTRQQDQVIATQVKETEELTDDEQNDRLHLERKVERAFYEAGRALGEL